MKLRVRLADLKIDLAPGPVSVPSIPDKVFDLPETPASEVFRGKTRLEFHDIEIKWAFQGGIPKLQQRLIDDPTLDSASAWFYIKSTDDKVDVCEAFVNGQEVPMQGRWAAMVER